MRIETVAALAEEVRVRPPLAGGVRVVAIEGRSGSGKTALSDALSAELGWPVFRMEDVYPGWTGLAASAELLALWVVMPLLNGANPRWRRYDWELGRHAEWHDTPVVDGLVVEGCGCGAAELRPYVSTLVWIDTPGDVRRRRLDARDDALLYAPYRDLWARQEDLFYAEHTPRDYADVIVGDL
ncbi:hypothetical protein [Actinorugispora endophytica]|uniref:Uridine kinase n=1 Tax=Actinorugispora endophytica TaxID=1605990 RepID=A0A4R6URH5_9ACTN|nr:hypothetical protein [Actinorugispora endophytica]TDQ49592.1 uridine kinase [Actinorugispora endophytica]